MKWDGYNDQCCPVQHQYSKNRAALWRSVKGIRAMRAYISRSRRKISRRCRAGITSIEARKRGVGACCRARKKPTFAYLPC